MSNVSLDSFRQTETSIIYDKNGKEISALSGIKELYYLESDEIPDVLKKMFVQIEDKDFTIIRELICPQLSGRRLPM